MNATDFRGVIFDLDGTLLDTLTDLADAANRVLARHGWPTHARDAYRYFVGDGMRMLVERAIPADQRSAVTIDGVVREMHAEYGAHWAEATRPYAGVREMLDGLAGRGMQMAVLSNKPDEFTVTMVTYFFPNTSFLRVVGARPELPRKPDPTGALQIAAAMNLEPRRILYVGDTATDMKTAVAAGMLPIGVLWGFRDERELRESGARRVIGHPRELIGT